MADVSSRLHTHGLSAVDTSANAGLQKWAINIHIGVAVTSPAGLAFGGVRAGADKMRFLAIKNTSDKGTPSFSLGDAADSERRSAPSADESEAYRRGCFAKIDPLDVKMPTMFAEQMRPLCRARRETSKPASGER